jgi:hypothetical protein
MRPRLWIGARSAHDSSDDSDRLLGSVIVLINKVDGKTFAKQFRHMVLKTQDPNERYDAALTMFSANYYQRSHEFSGTLTALFGPSSTIADRAVAGGSCTLEFNEYRQQYLLPCQVKALDEHDVLFQSTYWHNRLFNPNMPAGVRVLAFDPDWRNVYADPPVV